MELVEGWTGRLTWTLTEDEVAIDGTGKTVSAVDLIGADGVPADTTGDFGWDTQASGIAYYDPDSGDLQAAKSPYRLRFQVTDGSGKVRWYPGGKPLEIVVYARGV